MISNNLEWPFRLSKKSLRILKFYFCQNFAKKFQKKTEISWNSKLFLSQNRLERISIFRQKNNSRFSNICSLEHLVFGKNNRNSQNGSGFKKNGQSKIGNFLDQFWSELIALDRKVPRMWNFWKFWNFRRFKKWPP